MLTARICQTTTTPKELPVSETDFQAIQVGDIVRYQTKQTGHRCGVVKSRDIDRKRRNSGTKYLKNTTAPLVVTIGIGAMNRKTVSLTRDQLLEWRPAASAA